MRSAAVTIGLLSLGAVGLGAQARTWVEPKPPCDIKPGFFRLNSAIVDLQHAAQQPQMRDHLLGQAQDVLVRSIRDDKQDKNPAAWYYLGRYYVEEGDAIGADTAFAKAAALAPQCKADIAAYTTPLAQATLNQGLTLWQAGNKDSGAVLLRRAYAVDSTQLRALFQLGLLYVDANQLDSASAVLRRAAQASAGDTAYGEARRDALLTVARISVRGVQSDPAVQKWQHTRYSRDSLAPYLTADSTVLARMQASAASRRARGARLSPTDQQSFSHDSAARGDAVSRDHAARDALQRQAAADSSAAQSVFQPAIASYKELVTAYPSNAEAAGSLASIYVQAGRRADAIAVFDGLFAHAGDLSAGDLYDLGQRLVSSRLWAPGIKAYALALERNPYHRNALSELGSAYVETKDGANAVATVQRLVGIDPMNKMALHLMGQAWELRGQTDSARKYTVVSDSLSVDITIASMVPDSSGVTLTGVATNSGGAAAKATHLTVEFLDAKGAILATQGVDIPAVPAGGSQQFQAHAAAKGAVGWRYRAA
ncbi:MAG TPA: tetratricopeptide repeat protein [Gemmatimonadales bacterium]|nr:tetratricopeptide repeat protein [Gemmatimonadales bacterium]